MTGGRSSTGRAAQPELGIVIGAFFYRDRAGRERTSATVRDIFGVELEAAPAARRELAARLRELAAFLDTDETDGGAA